MNDKKQKKQNKSGKKNNGDSRFQIQNDPKYFPVDGRTKIEPRFSEMFDDAFPILRGSKNKGKKESHFKSALKSVYKVDQSKEDAEVEKLKKIARELDAHDSDSDDSVDMNKKHFGLEDELEQEDEVAKLPKDESSEEGEGIAGEEDDVFDFSDNDEWEPEEVNSDEERHLEREDIWQKFLSEGEVSTLESGNETHRLAVMNFDSQLIDSTDLFVLFKTIAPTMGSVRNVTIYLSDFGKKKLEDEKINGPMNVFMTNEEYEKHKKIEKELEKHAQKEKREKFNSTKKKRKEMEFDIDFEEEEEGTDRIHPERIREYEFSKLKYYFAVVTCDSAQTANALYNDCDGREFETTAITMDLRFIPDDVSFEDREILNTCSKVPMDYKPKQNQYSKQIQSSNSTFTWDKDPPALDILKDHTFENLREDELANFLASSEEETDSSSEEEEEDEEEDENSQDDEKASSSEEEEIVVKKKKQKKDARKKYKDLLKLAKIKEIKKKGNDEYEDIHMEQTFDDSLEEVGKEIAKKTKENEKKENESWWETLERKRKEKKKKKKKDRIEEFKNEDNEEDEEEKQKKREQLELLVDENTDQIGYNMKKDFDKERQRRKKNKNQNIETTTNDEFDINDDRFGSLYEDPEFNIDPTHSKFKKTQTVEKIREKKLKRKENKSQVEKQKNEDDSLNLIVNKLKRKSKDLEKKNKKKKI